MQKQNELERTQLKENHNFNAEKVLTFDPTTY